jgi:hypothetical protein
MSKSITNDEWHVFSKIVYDSSKKTVKEIFNSELKRDERGNGADEESVKILKTLRALRGFGLIEPEEKKASRESRSEILEKKPSWESNSKIVVTDFGMFIIEHRELSKVIKRNA